MSSKLFKKAISRITPEEKVYTVKLIGILSNLKPEIEFYKEKQGLICDLIKDPKCGHIVPDKIVKWSIRKGLRPELICEDRTSWWSVSFYTQSKNKNE